MFEYYDALNTTDPTQTLRKPPHQDQGECVPGVMGLQGHCGSGGIREYNFCAGIALLWLASAEQLITQVVGMPLGTALKLKYCADEMLSHNKTAPGAPMRQGVQPPALVGVAVFREDNDGRKKEGEQRRPSRVPDEERCM